jgi:ATP-binding cassette, subfamily B, bacterial PglK
MSLLTDIWSILTPRQRRWTLVAQGLSLLMACSTVIGVASIAPFFAVLGDPALVEHSAVLHRGYAFFHFTSGRAFAEALGGAFLVLVLLANALNLCGSLVVGRLTVGIGNDLRTVLFSEYLNRPYLFHSRCSTAGLVDRIIHQAMNTAIDILQEGFYLITSVITSVLIVASVVIINPLVALCMLAAVAGGYVAIYIVLRRRLWHWSELRNRAFVEQTRIASDSLCAIKEVQVSCVQEFFATEFAHRSSTASAAAVYTRLAADSPKHVMECVAVCGLVGAALLLHGAAGSSSAWLGQLTFMGFAAYRLLPALHQAFAATVRIRSARAGFAEIAADLRSARCMQRAAQAVVGSWGATPERDITLERVCFRYADERPLALDNVSCRIRAGTMVGVVGPNGSGKTTLVDVIAGLLPPTSGEVRVDGIALTESNRAAWQSRIGYVPQNPFLLQASIAENIALGIRLRDIDWKRLREAARLAQLDAFVAPLPGGYHHVVAERGKSLSDGQRQRIGIARALYRDAGLLILDEATSSLDGATELEMRNALAALRGTYTIIVIAHRPGSLSLCDAVLELHGGRIVHGLRKSRNM